MTPRREAVCHPEFLEDLQHWIDTDRRTAHRLLEVMREVVSCVYLVKADRLEFLQGRYHD